MIQLKRACEKPLPEDGSRVLVERFWPQEVDEKTAKLDLWLKEVAPSAALHQAFGDSPAPDHWATFRTRYWQELENKHNSIKLLAKKSKEGRLTLVHSAHNPDHSSAAVLKEFLEQATG
jgi:uncharacterized protein YeaO (DUF488 family)